MILRATYSNVVHIKGFIHVTLSEFSTVTLRLREEITRVKRCQSTSYRSPVLRIKVVWSNVICFVFYLTRGREKSKLFVLFL